MDDFIKEWYSAKLAKEQGFETIEYRLDMNKHIPTPIRKWLDNHSAQYVSTYDTYLVEETINDHYDNATIGHVSYGVCYISVVAKPEIHTLLKITFPYISNE